MDNTAVIIPIAGAYVSASFVFVLKNYFCCLEIDTVNTRKRTGMTSLIPVLKQATHKLSALQVPMVFLVEAVVIPVPAVVKIKPSFFAVRSMWRAGKKRGRWLG